MDPVAFAMQYDQRPQALLASQNAQNQQGLENVLKGADIFQKGAIFQNELAQTKQLTMAQMAQNEAHFNIVQQLNQQQFEVAKQQSMADIAFKNAQLQAENIQNQQLTLAAQQAPLKLQNQAFLSQHMPDIMSPSTGAQSAVDLLSKVPYPEALTDQDRNSFLANANLAREKSSTNLAYGFHQAANLQILQKAFLTPGIFAKQFQTKDGDPNDPDNYDLPSLAQAVGVAAQNADLAKARLEIQGRIDQSNIMAGARTNTDKTRMSILVKQADQDSVNLTKARTSMNALTPQGQAAIKALEATAAQSRAAAQAATSGQSVPVPDSTGDATMQNPSGAAPATAAPNPAQSFWQTNFGAAPSNGQ